MRLVKVKTRFMDKHFFHIRVVEARGHIGVLMEVANRKGVISEEFIEVRQVPSNKSMDELIEELKTWIEL